MTPQRQPTATGDASDRLHVDCSRLLCDDGHSASRRGGAEKTQDSRGVDGWTATGLDAESRMRQEGGAVSLLMLLEQSLPTSRQCGSDILLGSAGVGRR